VSTDALNRGGGAGYGEITGITQTIRNLGASLGLAVLGSVFTSQNVDRVETTLTGHGVPASEADRIAHSVMSPGGGAGDLGSQAGAAAEAIANGIRLDIAHSTQTVVYIMAGIMVAAFIVGRLWLAKGRVEELEAKAPAEMTPA
jgi:hypothetical protein